MARTGIPTGDGDVINPDDVNAGGGDESADAGRFGDELGGDPAEGGGVEDDETDIDFGPGGEGSTIDEGGPGGGGTGGGVEPPDDTDTDADVDGGVDADTGGADRAGDVDTQRVLNRVQRQAASMDDRVRRQRARRQLERELEAQTGVDLDPTRDIRFVEGRDDVSARLTRRGQQRFQQNIEATFEGRASRPAGGFVGVRGGGAGVGAAAAGRRRRRRRPAERFGDFDFRLPEEVGGVDLPGGGREPENILRDVLETADREITVPAQEAVGPVAGDIGAAVAPSNIAQIVVDPVGVDSPVEERFESNVQLQRRAARGISRGGVQGAVDIATFPASAPLITQEAAEFGVEAVEETQAGRGEEFAQRAKAAGVEAGLRAVEAARERPFETAGALGSSVAISGGAIGAASRVSPRIGRAVSVGIQPGEEAAIAAGRRIPAIRTAVTKVPGTGVRREHFGRTEVDTETADINAATDLDTGEGFLGGISRPSLPTRVGRVSIEFDEDAPLLDLPETGPRVTPTGERRADLGGPLPAELEEGTLAGQLTRQVEGDPLGRQQLGLPISQTVDAPPLSELIGRFRPTASTEFGPLGEARLDVGRPVSTDLDVEPISPRAMDALGGEPLGAGQLGRPLTTDIGAEPISARVREALRGEPLGAAQLGRPLSADLDIEPISLRVDRALRGEPLGAAQLGRPLATDLDVEPISLRVREALRGDPLGRQQLGLPISQTVEGPTFTDVGARLRPTPTRTIGPLGETRLELGQPISQSLGRTPLTERVSQLTIRVEPQRVEPPTAGVGAVDLDAEDFVLGTEFESTATETETAVDEPDPMLPDETGVGADVDAGRQMAISRAVESDIEARRETLAPERRRTPPPTEPAAPAVDVEPVAEPAVQAGPPMLDVGLDTRVAQDIGLDDRLDLGTETDLATETETAVESGIETRVRQEFGLREMQRELARQELRQELATETRTELRREARLESEPVFDDEPRRRRDEFDPLPGTFSRRFQFFVTPTPGSDIDEALDAIDAGVDESLGDL